jgi:ABC-type transport system substrate-binding protein
MHETYCPVCQHRLVVTAGDTAAPVECPECGTPDLVSRVFSGDLHQEPHLNAPPTAAKEPVVNDSFNPGHIHLNPVESGGSSQTASLPSNVHNAADAKKVKAPVDEDVISPPYSVVEDGSPGAAFLDWLPNLFSESRHLTSVLVVGAIGACFVAWYLWTAIESNRQERQIAEHWERADSSFRQTQFGPAREEYKRLSTLFTEWRRPPDENSALADSMAEICAACLAVERALNDQSADLHSALELLRNSKSPLLADSADASSQHATGSNDPASVDLATLRGLEFAPDLRWGEVVKWLAIRAESFAASLATTSPQWPDSAARLEQLIKALQEFGEKTHTLEDAAQAARTELEFGRRVDDFRQAGRRAVAQRDRASIDAARHLWNDLNKQHPDRVKPEMWVEHTEELRQSIVAGLKFVEPKDHVVPLGIVDRAAPAIVPIGDAGASVSGERFSHESPSRRRVFVKYEDCCYALDAATGEPEWVCRVGYEVPWLPERIERDGGDLVVVPWSSATEMCVTVASAVDLAPLWTLHLPADSAPAGLPIVLDDNVYVLLNRGELWKLRLSDGHCTTALSLPEAVAGPLVIDRANRIAVCTGRDMAIYVIDLGETPSVRSVVLRPEPSTNEQYFGMWINPFLVHFQNQITGDCSISVFRADGRAMSQVQSLVVRGKLWQEPGVRGNSLFLMTDRGLLSVFVLQPDPSSDPLVTVFSREDEKAADAHPYFVSHAEAPCVTANGSTIECFWIDSRRPRSDRALEMLWTREVRFASHVVSQDLQTTNSEIVVISQQPKADGVTVECLAPQDGKLKWVRRIAEPAQESQPVVAPKPSATPAGVPAEAKTPFQRISHVRKIAAGPSARRILRIGYVGAPLSLNPCVAASYEERELLGLLFDRLLEPDRNGSRFVKGRVLESFRPVSGYRIEPDGSSTIEYEFQLKAGATFADGTPLTAQSVCDCIEALRSSELYEIGNSVVNVRVTGSHRFSIEIVPHPFPERLFAFFIATERRLPGDSQLGQTAIGSTVGTGPYRIAQRLDRRSLELALNDTVPSETADSKRFDTLILKQFSRARTAAAVDELGRGALDVLWGAPVWDKALLQVSREQNEVRTIRANAIWVLAFDHRHELFQHRAVRRAVWLAIDTASLETQANVLQTPPAAAIRLTGPFPPQSIAYDSSLPARPTNEIVARALIEDAGEMAQRPLVLSVPQGDPALEAAAQQIAAQLGRVGLRVQETTRPRAFDFAIYRIAHDEGLQQLAVMFDPSLSVLRTGETNFMRYAPQALLDLFVNLRRTQDAEVVSQIQHRLHRYFYDDVSFVPLWPEELCLIWSKRLVGPGTVATGAGERIQSANVFGDVNDWQTRSETQ